MNEILIIASIAAGAGSIAWSAKTGIRGASEILVFGATVMPIIVGIAVLTWSGGFTGFLMGIGAMFIGAPIVGLSPLGPVAVFLGAPLLIASFLFG